jgi:hypothetical protein
MYETKKKMAAGQIKKQTAALLPVFLASRMFSKPIVA